MVAPTRITKVTDLQLVKLFNELHDELRFLRVHVYFGGGTSTVYEGAIDRSNFESRSQFIQGIHAIMPNQSARVIFARGAYALDNNTIDVNRFQNNRISANFDEYWLGGDSFTVEQVQEISRKFRTYQYLDLTGSGADSSIVDVLASHVEQLRELQLDFHQQQLNVDDQLRQRRTELEAASDARLEEQRQYLEQDRAELERLRKELNDREPKHERRRLRENLTGDIKSLLQNPPQSAFLRKNYTYLSFVATGAFLIIISLFLTSDLARFLQAESSAYVVPNAAFIIQAIKSLAAGAGGGAFLWAGLNGMKKSEELARQIYDRLQRYSHDMDRASWIVETLLELNAVESAQVPDVWLEAVCSDLFVDAAGARSTQPDSLEALGALLDATARARVGTDGFQFELERPQARKLARSAS
jgi:hypothetical protein